MVYIQEAHASDAWQDAQNLRDNILVPSPLSFADRERAAASCVRNLGLEMPALVDGIGNPTEAAYTAWPDRLYVIDRAGRVAWKSEAGPYGFRPAEAEAALKQLCGAGC